jgi:preprotein translocase subunit SecA
LAMLDIFTKLFDRNERDIKRYRKIVEKVNALEPEFEKLTDEQIVEKTAEFKRRVKEIVGDESEYKDAPALLKAYNEALDQILPEAFANCREAAKRILKMRHYDVQMIGGMVQHDGRISELRTGEGKTLTCSLATYLNALADKGVHVVTANDYLVKRDAVWMGPLYHGLGLSIGILQGHSPETGEGGGTFIYDPTYEDPSVDGLDARFRYARQIWDRREAYSCDLLYGTSAELGFDYLRDNMAPSEERIVQHRGHWFASIDECDSNLIDDARTPLIISGTAEKSSELYHVLDKCIPNLEKGTPKKDKYDTETDEKDFTVDERAKSATFTESGLDKIEKMLGIEDISAIENIAMMQHAVAALKAHAVFELDKDYVIRPNQEGKPEIVIVDENTGRLMFGRRWSDGLHQAIEAKEQIPIENEQQTLATITIQNYFRLYPKISGMTGTAKTEEPEFQKIYRLDVVQVPTNKPMIRKDLADIIYKTEEAKMRGIVTEILQLFGRQQPVLVGTRSIDMSEKVSRRLEFQALEVLAAISIIRPKLNEKAKEIGDKYGQINTVLNRKIDDLTMLTLTPIAKELGVSVKFFEKNQPAEGIEELRKVLGVDEAGKEHLAEALLHGIPHNVLNAKFHEQEARIIAEAGRAGAVTIATNMAGRGVDILLGGTHYKGTETDPTQIDYSYKRGGRRSIGHTVTAKDKPDDAGTLGPAGAGTISLSEAEEAAHDISGEREIVRNAGGLYILGTERHESRRIDNQLRGRAGRQGDPGASKFHVSLEDYLWRVFGDRNSPIMSRLMEGWDESESVDMPMLSKMIERAQKKVEQHHFDGRKHVLEYDEVKNKQREVIYKERRKILQGADLKETLTSHLTESVDNAIAIHCPDNIPPEDWDKNALYNDLNTIFPLANFISEEQLSDMEKPELQEKLPEIALEAYTAKEALFGPELMRDIERHIARQAIDQAWVDHLGNMDYLQEGIGLRSYAQTDPMVAYKKESQELFEHMLGGVQGDIVRNLFMAQAQQEQEEQSLFDMFQQMELHPDMLSTGEGEDDAVDYEAQQQQQAVASEINSLRQAAAEAEMRRRQEQAAIDQATQAQSEERANSNEPPAELPLMSQAPVRKRKKDSG